MFVSHNLSQVQGLCRKGMLLEHGQLKILGDINKVISEYVIGNQAENKIMLSDLPRVGPKSADFHLTALVFENDTSQIKVGDEIVFSLSFDCKTPFKELIVGFNITDTLGNLLVECRTSATYKELNIEQPGNYTYKVRFQPNLSAGIYVINTGARCVNGNLEYVPSSANLEILPVDSEYEEWNKPSAGIINTISTWEKIN